MKRIAIIAAIFCVGGVASAQSRSSLPSEVVVAMSSSELTTLEVSGRSNAKTPQAYPQKSKSAFSLNCRASQHGSECKIKVDSFEGGGDRFGLRGDNWLNKKRSVAIKSAQDGALSPVPQMAGRGGDLFELASAQLIALLPKRAATGEWKAQRTLDIEVGGVFRNARIDASYRRTGSDIKLAAKVSGAGTQGKGKVTVTGSIGGTFRLGADGQVVSAKLRLRAKRTIELEKHRATVEVDRSMTAKSASR